MLIALDENLLQKNIYIKQGWHKFFSLQATIKDCEQLSISTTATATTFYGVPDPVANASVVNTTDAVTECVIEWEHDGEISSTSNYKVRRQLAK